MQQQRYVATSAPSRCQWTQCLADAIFYLVKPEVYLTKEGKICDVQGEKLGQVENQIFYHMPIIPPKMGHSCVHPTEGNAVKLTEEGLEFIQKHYLCEDHAHEKPVVIVRESAERDVAS